MPLLNPPEVLPDVIRMLVETVAHEGPMSADALLACVSPGELGGEKSLAAKASLNAARTLGFLDELDGELVARDDLVAQTRSSGTLRPDWPRLLVDALVHHESFRDTVTASVGEDRDRTGVRDLAYALTWLHAQDRYGSPLHWDASGGRSGVQLLQAEQFGGGEDYRRTYPVINDTRWNTLHRWAVAMDLATVAPAGRDRGSGALVPDPSCQVRRIVARAHADGIMGEVCPVLDVCDLIADRLPFLWRGILRNDLAARLGFDPDPDAALDAVDSSVAAALLYLQARGEVVIEDQADASYRTVLDASGDGRLGVTHIRFTSEVAQ